MIDLDRTLEITRLVDDARIAAPQPKGEVADHEGHADREKNFGLLESSDPAQQHALGEQSESGDGETSSEKT